MLIHGSFLDLDERLVDLSISILDLLLIGLSGTGLKLGDSDYRLVDGV